MTRRHRRRRTAVTVVLASVCALGGCDSDGGQTADGVGSGGGGTPEVASATAEQPDGGACDLLSGAEVTEAIGEHTGGEQDYLYGGCLWPSTHINENGAAWGLRVSIGISDEEFDSFDPDPGESVGDVGPDATYNEIDGALWFTCGGQHCVVRVVIDPPADARTAAIELAGLLQERADR